MPDIFQELCTLADSDMYPFHMPGHKRNVESTPLKGAFRCDITEIDGFDNLHKEEGIILEAEKRAADLYGADSTFFLVNGSTAGVLAAVSATVSENGRILAARGSHKSFYHCAYLRHLDINYLPIKMIDNYGIFDGYEKEEVEDALNKTTGIEAVFITSPTYEGRCSDVEGIAEVCHKRGIPLIVDCAHGAHFGMGENVPKSPVELGADVVIMSVHKTLPSMTQTALIHLKSNLVNKERLKRFLTIYQSSSPSYVLMASIDLCIKELCDNGKRYIEDLISYRKLIQDETRKCKVLKIPDLNELQDPAKVLIYTGHSTVTGQQLYDILREDYKLQLEMAGEKYALAILTGWDTEDGIRRLIAAINEIDSRIQLDKTEGKKCEIKSFIPSRALLLNEAWDKDVEVVELGESEGRIAGDFVNLYPPGIPLIIPGEVIDKAFLENVSRYIAEGLNVQGVLELENGENKGIIGKRGILCVKQR